MRSGRPGPVLVDLPFDVQLRKSSLILTCTNRCRSTNLRQPYADRKSGRNVNPGRTSGIVAGGGVINADAAALLQQFAN